MKMCEKNAGVMDGRVVKLKPDRKKDAKLRTIYRQKEMREILSEK